MTASVVRFVAMYRARQDQESAAVVVETSLLSIALFLALGLGAAYPLLVAALRWAMPTEHLGLAVAVLPYALFALWINCISSVVLGALDGCQRAGLRNLVLIGVNLVFFGAAILLASRLGIYGLAVAQIIQATASLCLSWMVLRHVLPTTKRIPHRWSFSTFREMFSYSANFQVTAVTAMLFDPLTKILMGKFGGLGAAAYYEMANQLVTKVRSVIVSANQVMVPVVAETAENERHVLPSLYTRSYSAVFLASVPIYLALAISVPLVSDLWIGRIEPQFLVFAYVLVAAYFVNNLEVPAHFDNLGTGSLRWNTIGQATMSILNGALGFAMGMGFGASGISAASGSSIVVGSLIVLFAVQRKYQLPVSRLVPTEHRAFSRMLIIVAFLSLLGTYASIEAGWWNRWVGFLVGAVFAVSIAVGFTKHPYWHPTKELLRRGLLGAPQRDAAST